MIPSPYTSDLGDVSASAGGDVLFISELASLLRTSRSTIERRIRSGSFPIPPLPSLDKRSRWSRHAVEQFLRSTSGGLKPRRGRPRRSTAA